MSDKTPRRGHQLTLSSSYMDGYSGPVRMTRRLPQPWWRRLLRLKQRWSYEPYYVNAKGSTARAWPYHRASAKRRATKDGT